jgi:hypothetical protein
MRVEPAGQPEVRDIHIVTDAYRFNDQATAVEHHDYTVPCNRQSCNGSIDLQIPAASRIVEFEAYFTATGFVQPESNHVQRRVPFNTQGIAYPEKIDTRFSGLRLAQPLLVPFPPGAPIGRRIYRCGPDCVKRLGGYKEKLERAYRNGIWASTADQSLLDQGGKADAHHIQELQWNGDNSLENGLLLLKQDHLEFTNWWRGVHAP